jgi:hypothetical protein
VEIVVEIPDLAKIDPLAQQIGFQGKLNGMADDI